MRRLGLLPLILFALAACTAGTYEAGTPSRGLNTLLENDGYSSVDLQALRTGHHVLNVRINGADGIFALDSGANVSAVHSAFAEYFALEGTTNGLGKATGLGGRTQAAISRVQSIQLDGVSVAQPVIYLLDLTGVVESIKTNDGENIHGIIGQDILRSHNAIIDITGNRLYIKQ